MWSNETNYCSLLEKFFTVLDDSLQEILKDSETSFPQAKEVHNESLKGRCKWMKRLSESGPKIADVFPVARCQQRCQRCQFVCHVRAMAMSGDIQWSSRTSP